MADIFKLSTGSVATGLQTKYNDMLAGNPFFNPYSNSYTSLQTVTVGSGGASSITFSSIPSTYTHLQMRYFSRGTYATSSPTAVAYRFNSDTGSNYAIHYLYGDGSATTAGAFTSVTVGYAGNMSDAFNSSNVFGAGVMDILDYANTNKYKTTRSIDGYDANGSGQALMHSGLWQSTSAITSITLIAGAGNFDQYSSFALYGVN